LLDHGAIERQDFPPEGSQVGGSAARTSPTHFDQGLAEAIIHDFNQRPRSHIGHAQTLRSFGNRTMIHDGGEKVCFAGAESDFSLVKNSWPKLHRGHGT
jgi:hypothetical protein